MNNIISSFYNIFNIELYKENDIYFFRYHDFLYSFEPVINLSRFLQILSVLKLFNISLHGFFWVYNIYGDLLTKVENKYYILFCHNRGSINLLYEVKHPLYLFQEGENFFVDRWDIIWARKIDYYENEMEKIGKNVPAIYDSFSFFIGLAENAVSYINYNYYSIKSDKSNSVFLSHYRIDENNFFNPLNLKLDYYSRDVAEYIKFLFYNNHYSDFSFLDFFSKINLSYDDYVFIYARLLFPSFYFDLLDRFLNTGVGEAEIKKVIDRQREYFLFINTLFYYIPGFSKVPKILWIKKEML